MSTACKCTSAWTDCCSVDSVAGFFRFLGVNIAMTFATVFSFELMRFVKTFLVQGFSARKDFKIDKNVIKKLEPHWVILTKLLSCWKTFWTKWKCAEVHEAILGTENCPVILLEISQVIISSKGMSFGDLKLMMLIFNFLRSENENLKKAVPMATADRTHA